MSTAEEVSSFGNITTGLQSLKGASHSSPPQSQHVHSHPMLPGHTDSVSLTQISMTGILISVKASFFVINSGPMPDKIRSQSSLVCLLGRCYSTRQRFGRRKMKHCHPSSVSRDSFVRSLNTPQKKVRQANIYSRLHRVIALPTTPWSFVLLQPKVAGMSRY